MRIQLASVREEPRRHRRATVALTCLVGGRVRWRWIRPIRVEMILTHENADLQWETQRAEIYKTRKRLCYRSS